MVFKREGLDPNSSGSTGLAFGTYRTADSMETVTADGYFDQDWALLRGVASLRVLAADDEADYRLTVQAENVTLKQISATAEQGGLAEGAMQKDENLSDVTDLGEAQGNLQAGVVFGDKAMAQAAYVAARHKSMRLQFHSIETLKGGAKYKRVAAQPAHGVSVRTLDRFLPDGSVSAANGGWWEVDEVELNPYMAGAKGGRVADDFAAIQAVCNAGRVVRIPSDHFNWTGRLRIPADRFIFGDNGATLHRVTSGDIVNWPLDQDRGQTPTTAGHDGWGNITLQNLVIEAHGDTIALEQNVITFNHARDCRAIDVKVRNTCGFHAFEVNGIERGFFLRCISEGYRTTGGQTGKEAFQIDSASNATNGADSGLTDGTFCKRVTFRECEVRASTELAAHPIGIGSHGVPILAVTGEDILIERCHLRATTNGVNNMYTRRVDIRQCNIANTTSSAIRNFNSDEVTVEGCQIENSGLHSISLLGTSRWGIVSRNRVMGTAAGGSGIYLEGDAGNIGGDHKVCDNITYRTASYAFHCGRMRDTLVSNNLFEGAHYPAGSSAGVMHVSNANSYVSNRIGFTGNRTVVHGGGVEAAVGLSVSAGQIDIWAVDNDFKGYAAATSGTVNTTSNRI